MDKLPEELLVFIFTGLCLKDIAALTRVSKKIRRIAYDKTVWRDIEIIIDPYKLPHESALLILKGLPIDLFIDCGISQVRFGIIHPCCSSIKEHYLTNFIINHKCEFSNLTVIVDERVSSNFHNIMRENKIRVISWYSMIWDIFGKRSSINIL